MGSDKDNGEIMFSIQKVRTVGMCVRAVPTTVECSVTCFFYQSFKISLIIIGIKNPQNNQGLIVFWVKIATRSFGHSMLKHLFRCLLEIIQICNLFFEEVFDCMLFDMFAFVPVGTETKSVRGEHDHVRFANIELHVFKVRFCRVRCFKFWAAHFEIDIPDAS